MRERVERERRSFRSAAGKRKGFSRGEGKQQLKAFVSVHFDASPSLPLRPRPFQAEAKTHRRAALGANLGLGRGGGSGAVLSADGQPDAWSWR